ncbi:glycosyl hydrolase family 28-related protein [Sphingobacterium griseoflavum]|uniref:Rhamnogalacturonase A/B/Epimerase-like pectate lyase domain-containing protein n=1 Tax=Sphingobacterium griseoflavum TaxID=1474952 RepID=A0ABQ3HV92_9SPHI|nr:glycosyl hydrolase family 28-related protein [Sphingobacterium griseoflavum]GHE34956.1 hypothetical protein GCM10017764_17670 [Sphingobacterium griseoflavum]
MATVEFWKGMQKASDVAGSDKMMFGEDASGEVKYIDFNQAKDYLTITGQSLDPIPSGALPTPEAGQVRTMEVVGPDANPDGSPATATWTHPTLPGGQASLVTGQAGVFYFNGTAWALRNVRNVKGEPGEDGASLLAPWVSGYVNPSTGSAGYPLNAAVVLDDGKTIVRNTIESNTSNPNAGGEGWLLVGGNTENLNSILKSFLQGNTNPDPFFNADYTFTSAINGTIKQTSSGVLKSNNTFELISEPGETLQTWLNIPTLLPDGNRIAKIRFKGFKYNVANGQLSNLIGVSENGITNLLPSASGSSQVIPIDEEFSLLPYSAFSLSFSFSDANRNNIGVELFDLSGEVVEDAVLKEINNSQQNTKLVLKSFLENITESKEISLENRHFGYLTTDNVVHSEPEYNYTLKDIDITGWGALKYDFLPIQTNVPGICAALLIDDSDNKTVLINSQPQGTNTPLSGIVDISGYTKLSLCWSATYTGETKFLLTEDVNYEEAEDRVLRKIQDATGYVLSFKDFGAACDGVTNDTQAFVDGINHLIALGGGKILLPAGEMLINQTAIPFVPSSSWMTIQIEGESVATGVFGSIGAFPVNKKNSVIKCLDTDFDVNKGVIYTTAGSGYANFNWMTFVLRNMVIRTSNPSSINGLNLHNFQQAVVENVNIDNGVYAGQVDEPMLRTHGIKMPSRDNGAYSYMKNVSVSGYWDGMILQEHVMGDNLIVNGCKTSYVIQGAGHPVYVTRALSQKCHRVLEVINDGFSSIFEIAQLVVEKSSTGTITPGHEWQLPDTYDVYDDDASSAGNITYTCSVGGEGLGFTINKSPLAENINVRKVGFTNWN